MFTFAVICFIGVLLNTEVMLRYYWRTKDPAHLWIGGLGYAGIISVGAAFLLLN